MLYLETSIVLNQLFPKLFVFSSELGIQKPRKTNATMERLLCRKSKADRLRSAKQILQMLPLHNISVQTIQRRLCKNQLVAHAAQKKKHL